MNTSKQNSVDAKREERAAARQRRTWSESHARAAALLAAASESASEAPGVTAGMPTHLWLRSLAAREITGSSSEVGLQAVIHPAGLRQLPGGTSVCTNDGRLLTVHHMGDEVNLLDIHAASMHVGTLPESAYPLTIWDAGE